MTAVRLTEGSVGKHLYRMSLPMFWGLLGNMSIQLVDTWFISQLGDQPLAAMGFVFPVAMIFISLSIGLSAGASSVIARQLASSDKSSLKRLITDTQLLCLLLAVSASIVGWLTINPLFMFLGASAELMSLIREYIQIFYVSAIIGMLGMCALSSVRALGNARLQGNAMLLAAAINAVLDPILIFGLFGMPRLELQGAALASLIARLITFALAYAVLLGKMHLLTTPFTSLLGLLSSWKKILHIALPAMGTNMIIPISATIITVLLATYGESAVAGMGVASRIEPLMLIPFYALSAVIGPFVGQNLGAGHAERVVDGVVKSCQFSMLFGLFLAFILWLFAGPIVRLFSDSVMVVTVAVDYLWLVPISYGCAGVVMIINAAFNGIGKPFPATIISALRVLFLYLPLAYLGAYLYDIRGIFIAYTLVNILCAGFGYYWFLRDRQVV